ncbi:MAG: FAD-binding protein, partial [Bdellovibrio sp.]
MNTYDVILIGAGLSGLTQAIELTQSGQKVLLLEALPQPGGLCRKQEFYKDFFIPGLFIDSSLLPRPQGLHIESSPTSFYVPHAEMTISSHLPLCQMPEEEKRGWIKLINLLDKAQKPLLDLFDLKTPFSENIQNPLTLLKAVLHLKQMGKTDMTSLFRYLPM